MGVQGDAGTGKTHMLKRVRALFETNDWSGDLRSTLRDGDHQGATWNNITRWIEGIVRLPHIVSWSELSPAPDEERRKQALRKVVAVNLKKSPGGSEANDDKLRGAAQANRDLLLAQLSIIRARLRDLLP